MIEIRLIRARLLLAFVWATVPSLLISMAAAIWCGWSAGGGLELFLGATLICATYVPALTLAEHSRLRILPPAGALLGTALVWLILKDDVRAMQWLQCCVVLAAFVWALAGVAALLVSARIGHATAAAVTVTLALLWLTWPVWLSHALTQGMADWLVPAHPLMAINGVLKHLGSWDRSPLAYRALMTLNQDVPYRLPATIFPALLLHLALGLPGFWLSFRGSHRESPAVDQPPAQPALP